MGDRATLSRCFIMVSEIYYGTRFWSLHVLVWEKDEQIAFTQLQTNSTGVIENAGNEKTQQI